MPFANILLLLIPLWLSLTVHEWAHAWSAYKLGDDTAKQLGRLSLNPLDHIDPVGTFLLPLVGIPFGWAKPVPFNPVRFHRGVSTKRGSLIVAFAGPVSNVVLAFFCTGSLYILFTSGFAPAFGAVDTLLERLIRINLVLAAFNLIPIPPLDGSHIVNALVPNRLRPVWNQIMAIGPFGLLIIIFSTVFLGVDLFAYPLEAAQALIGLAK
jgi:Zn-dependent protease